MTRQLREIIIKMCEMMNQDKYYEWDVIDQLKISKMIGTLNRLLNKYSNQ